MKEILVIPKKKPFESQESFEEFKKLLDQPQLLYSLYIHSKAHEYSDFVRKIRLNMEMNQSYQDKFLQEKIKSRSSNLTEEELEYYFNVELPIIVKEIVTTELDNRINNILENARRVAREEIQISSADTQQYLIKDIEFDEAKELVENYLKENKIASLSELAENLKIDLCMLSDIIQELQEKNLIKEKEE